MKRSASIAVEHDSIFSPFPAESWVEAFRWAAQSGFNAVELILADPDLVDMDALQRETVRLGLTVSTISTGQATVLEQISLTAPQAYLRREAMERIKRQVDYATRVGGANVTIGLIRGKGGGLPYHKEYELLKHNLTILADYAAKKTITLNLEPINRYEVCLINSTQEGYELLEDIGDPENVGLLYDTFHSNIEDSDMIESIKKYGHRFSHVHLADSNRRLPGEGHVEFPAVMKALEIVGYDDYVAIEVLNIPSSIHIINHASLSMQALSGE